MYRISSSLDPSALISAFEQSLQIVNTEIFKLQKLRLSSDSNLTSHTDTVRIFIIDKNDGRLNKKIVRLNFTLQWENQKSLKPLTEVNVCLLNKDIFSRYNDYENLPTLHDQLEKIKAVSIPLFAAKKMNYQFQEDKLELRPAKDEDLDYAYKYLFKPGIEKVVKELTNEFNRISNQGPIEEEWPIERYEFFKKGFLNSKMMMISSKEGDIGCFCIAKTNDSIELQRVYIREDFQGHGIGENIVQEALEIAHEMKLPLKLEVLANNRKAIDAYKKCGFEQSTPVIAHCWNKKFTMIHKDTIQYLFKQDIFTSSSKL